MEVVNNANFPKKASPETGHQFMYLLCPVWLKNISVLQLFISRMPKMCAIPQLVSAPLNPIPIAEHHDFRRSHPQCEHSYGQHIYMSRFGPE